MKTVLIEIATLIGEPYCIAEEDGARVAEAVSAALRDSASAHSTSVQLSFADVRMLTTPFIRALFVPLLEQFSSEQLNNHVQISEIRAGDRARIKLVIDDVKLRLRDPQSYEHARQRALEMT